MERVHKANLLVILACVLTMSVTTVMSYGMSTRTIKGCGVLWATLIIVMIVQSLQVSDFVKAMVIVLCPSYAVLIYSGLVNGNSIAFLANFITLCMAVRYFDKKIIKYYAIPFTATCVVCLFINVKIIDGAFVGCNFKNLFICNKCSAFISWDEIWGEKDKAGRSGTLPGAGKYSSCQPDCF